MVTGLATGGRIEGAAAIALRPVAGVRPDWRSLALYAALFLLALAPRLIGLEQHLTPDDKDWMRRASLFSRAVRSGTWGGTFQSGHPGVTVLWLTAAAIGPERADALAARSDQLLVMVKAPEYLPALFDARRALAVISAGLVVLVAYLAARLLGPRVGLLAGLLLANEPFLVAHARLLHSDHLVAQLMALAILAALIYFGGRGGWPYLIGSGVACGLAFITKAPAAILFGFVPLTALIAMDRPGRDEDPNRSDRSRVAILSGLAVWGTVAAVIVVAGWPALWVDPLGTFARMASGVAREADTAPTWGDFFAGQVSKAVGPLFYPLVTALRLSPITLGGLVLLGAEASRRGVRSRTGTPVNRPPAASWPGKAGVLLAFCVTFTLGMAVSPKQADRYLLPVYPILVILAALGLRLTLRRLCAERLRLPATLGLALGQAALVASVQPYPLSFYDPLLGGASAARQAVLVGWGEGLDQIAAYLDRQPDAAALTVATMYADVVPAQFRGAGVPLRDWPQADYLVDYVNMEQRQVVPEPLRTAIRGEEPLYTARINGLDYAYLYRIPPELRASAAPAGPAPSPQSGHGSGP